MRVAVLGTGFAGTILARILHRQGHTVALLERGRHPRFALGESATPLAAICLERLADRYGLDDLRDLAAYGRWMTSMPEVRRGLKRGFTFYGHRPGAPWESSEAARVLVAASPSDGIADSHWLRADVDARLVAHAEAEGVEVRQGFELTTVQARGASWRLRGRHGEREAVIDATLVVDASGAGEALRRHLDLSEVSTGLPMTRLLGGHLNDARELGAARLARLGEITPGPYPDERAAVHHLLEEGWLYALRFDHGTCSAGFELLEERLSPQLRALLARDPEAAWMELLGRYPSLGEQLGDARFEVGPLHVTRLQRRLARAAGPGWALLPHAYCFQSPLFSTGIAWSLLGVERLGLLLAERRTTEGVSGEELAPYADLLAAEADHLANLLAGAYGLLHRPDLFAPYGLLYFAAASFAEASQRLIPRPPTGADWAWDGFLGAGDRRVREAVARVRAVAMIALAAANPEQGSRELWHAVRQAIAPFDVAGLSDPGHACLFPIDFEALLAHADLLGLSREEVERGLPRLRGGS